MKHSYEITFWVEPTKHSHGYITKRVYQAKAKSEAIYDAEDKHPGWSVIAVKELKEKSE